MCDDIDQLPVIDFLFGGYWLQMIPEDYVIEDTYTIGTRRVKRCSLCILDNGDESWLLGDAFMRGYYHVHDHANKKFGFAPHSLSTKDTPFKEDGSTKFDATLEDSLLSVELLPSEKVTMVILAVVGAVLIGFIIWYCIAKPKAAKAVLQ